MNSIVNHAPNVTTWLSLQYGSGYSMKTLLKEYEPSITNIVFDSNLYFSWAVALHPITVNKTHASSDDSMMF